MRCIIFGSSIIDNRTKIDIHNDDIVICADAGYDNFKKIFSNKSPDLIIGDLDSSSYNRHYFNTNKLNTIIYNKDKDDSDVMLSVKKGFDLGFKSFVLYGCSGGRFDHYYANIQVLSYILKHGGFGKIINGFDELFLISVNSGFDSFTLDKTYKNYTISVFSYGDKCIISSNGLFFEMDEKILHNDFPLGLSNRFSEVSNEIYIKVSLGCAIVFITK